MRRQWEIIEKGGKQEGMNNAGRIESEFLNQGVLQLALLMV